MQNVKTNQNINKIKFNEKMHFKLFECILGKLQIKSMASI